MAARKKSSLKLDEIGYWSEIKLDIIREYARAYSKILAAQQSPSLYHVYVDAFAGAGIHKSKRSGELVDGSPLIAAATEPPFKHYHFIDLNGHKAENLRAMFQSRRDVTVHEGNCNEIMLRTVLPKIQYKDYRRGLCLLDPYGLHLNWEVIQATGASNAIDMFLNFPIADMNRNVFWHNPEGVDDADIMRMNALWGDESWRSAARKPVRTLFGMEDEKTDNETVASAFRERLKKVAGFKEVPAPLPMRNSVGATVYYLFFASPKSVANAIVTHIFNKYRNRGTQ
jgi:three-Cys-motif partner protein